MKLIIVSLRHDVERVVIIVHARELILSVDCSLRDRADEGTAQNVDLCRTVIELRPLPVKVDGVIQARDSEGKDDDE